jgi:hypothetical protein
LLKYLVIVVLASFLLAGCASINGTASPSPSPSLIGGDADEHGCIGSAGYIWCEAKSKCLRVWEENCTAESTNLDEHGCVGSAGPAWCESRQACIISHEENCPAIGDMTQAEARSIAEASSCVNEGAIGATEGFNENSQTWWFMLDVVKAGCAPACVVSADGSAEVNWRCTGLIEPSASPTTDADIPAAPSD